MESKRTATTYFIPPGKFLLMENALGNPDLIQSSVSSDCRVTIVDSANFPLDELEQWPTFRLTSADIKLKLGDGAYYIYIVVPTPDNTESTSAFISYNTALVDRDGYQVIETEDEEGNPKLEKGELLGKSGFKYYQCGVISARGGNASATTSPSGQGRLLEMDLGVTPAPSTLPGDLNDLDKIFRLDKVDPDNVNSWLLTILLLVKQMAVRLLRVTDRIIFGEEGENEKPITNVKRTVDSDNEFILDENGYAILDEDGNPIKDPKFVPVSDETIPTTAWVNKQTDGKYLSKQKDDRSVGTVASDKGFEVGQFTTGMIGGSGAKMYLDENGKSVLEIDKIAGREELIVPSITFNTIEVVSGDKANTFAYGRIKSVEINKDGTGGYASLDLLDDEYGTLKPFDILRGVFHNIDGGNDFETTEDGNGFLQYSGFFTSYFTPTEIVKNEAGEMAFNYSIQDGTKKHPCAGMNFYAYGNFIDEERQSITYENRDYRRRLVNMNTWSIQPTKNIVMQDGKLDGLNIGGYTMSGYGTFQTNSYFTGVQIQFTPGQLSDLKGEDAYSVNLSSYEGLLKVDVDGNITSGMTSLSNVIAGSMNVTTRGENVVTTDFSLKTVIQAYRGSTPLFYSKEIGNGSFIASIRTVGCVGQILNGTIVITEITDLSNCRVTVSVNCEGKYYVELDYHINAVYDGKVFNIETIYSKHQDPERPADIHPYVDNEEWNHEVSEENVFMAMATKENDEWTPWQVTRIKGFDGFDYKVYPESISIGRSLTGSLSPSSVLFTCYRVGAGERVEAKADWRIQRYDGTDWVDTDYSKTDVSAISYDFPSNAGYKSYRFIAIPREYDKVEAIGTAAILEDGSNGQMARYRGVYKENEEYVWDDTYRDIVIYDGHAYQVNSYGDKVSGVFDASRWNSANTFDFVAMNTALIHEANIAGFTFFLDCYDDFGNPVGRLESQNKKIILDAKEGKLTCIEAELDGNLKVGSLRLKQRDTEGSLNGYSMGLGGNIYTLPILNDGENIELKLLYPRVDSRTAPTLFMVQLDSQYMTGGSQSGKASIVVPDDDNVWAKIDTSAVLKENIIYSLFGFCNNGYTTWYIGGSYGSTSSLPINIMVDKTLIKNSKNAVAGGAVYAEFEEVREEIKNISGGVVFINSTNEIEKENVLYVMG